MLHCMSMPRQCYLTKDKFGTFINIVGKSATGNSDNRQESWLSQNINTDKFDYFLLFLDFQTVVTRLSHDQVAHFKTFRDTVQNCARQTINHAASMIKQAQLQLCG